MNVLTHMFASKDCVPKPIPLNPHIIPSYFCLLETEVIAKSCFPLCGGQAKNVNQIAVDLGLLDANLCKEVLLTTSFEETS